MHPAIPTCEGIDVIGKLVSTLRKVLGVLKELISKGISRPPSLEISYAPPEYEVKPFGKNGLHIVTT